MTSVNYGLMFTFEPEKLLYFFQITFLKTDDIQSLFEMKYLYVIYLFITGSYAF